MALSRDILVPREFIKVEIISERALQSHVLFSLSARSSQSYVVISFGSINVALCYLNQLPRCVNRAAILVRAIAS